MAEPMITVKKADGTLVRVPLSEVKKMKESVLAATPAAISEVKPEYKIPVPEDALMAKGLVPEFAKISNDPLAEVKKLLSVPEITAAPTEMQLPAHAPLALQEPEPKEILHESVLGNPSYDDVVTRVLAEAKIIPPPALVARYQSLVMSAAKGVRTIEQVLRYAVMPDVQGGLGLDSASAERLGKALAHVPGIQVPISPIKRAQAPVSAINQSVTPVRPLMRDVEPPAKINQPAAPAAPRQVASVMGPVEEMQNFSLIDWRRLAVTPEKAAEIIMRKFAVWKTESFYLYQDTRAAWLSSPLIREYQKTLATAINENTRLSSLAMGSGNTRAAITAGDISALVAVNRSLAV